MKSKESVVKAVVIAVFSALLALTLYVIIYGLCKGYFSSNAAFQAYIKSFGIWGPVILTMIQGAQVLIPVLPSMLGYAAGSYLYGTWGGFLINYIGISLGSIVAFYLARLYGTKLVNKMIHMDKNQKFQNYIQRIDQSKSYSWILFISILLPMAPDDFLCYFTGLLTMSPKKFIAIIVIGKPWCLLAYSLGFTELFSRIF